MTYINWTNVQRFNSVAFKLRIWCPFQLWSPLASSWEEQERRDHKAKKKMNWITRGGFDTVIRVNPTPGGELAKQLQKVLDANPGPVKVKIQELGGTKVKNLLQKPNLTKTRSCDSKDCLACKNGRGEGGTAGEIMLAMF